MFQSSNKTTTIKLFTATSSVLSGKILEIYEDPKSWHNLFRQHIVERIDERIFRPLFSDDQGAPNAPIRILIGMMILKDARGWSDERLFEECQFNILTRSALGMLNMDDRPPVPSTYYLLRKRIVCWEKEGHGDLIEQVFAQVTKSQALEFNVSGKRIRMDSKLIGSNIAWFSRYELIHETLRLAYDSLKEQSIKLMLSTSDILILNSVSKERGEKVCYRSTKSEIESKMVELGTVIYKMIQQTTKNQSPAICTLRRVFQEQYSEGEGIVTSRPNHEISASSVQSPHDTDCHYRQKDDQKVKGYSVNVAETCDAGHQLNLVTHVSVEPASAADCDFLQPAIDATQEVVTQKIETTNADGAYHSIENQEYCKENEIDLIVSSIQGSPSRYDLTLEESGELTVIDLQTNTVVPSRKVESNKEGAEPKWAIRNDKNQHRYFTQKEITTCLLRHLISSRTPEELNVRNNVEATIFQLGYNYPHAKSRYRGIIKHTMWANVRCMWINFVRISKFVALNSLNYAYEVVNQYVLPFFYAHTAKNRSFLSYCFTFWFSQELTKNLVVANENLCPVFLKNQLLKK